MHTVILGVTTRKRNYGESTITGTQLRGSFGRKDGNAQSTGDRGSENHRKLLLHFQNGRRNRLRLGWVRRSGGVNVAETHQYAHRVRGILCIFPRRVFLRRLFLRFLRLLRGVEVHDRIVPVEAERCEIVLLRGLLPRGIRAQVVLLPLVLDLRIPPTFP